VTTTIHAVDLRCRACRHPLVLEGARLRKGTRRHAGRSLCFSCHSMTDDEVEKAEMARLYIRERAEWMPRAACATDDVDPEWFFPMDHDRVTLMAARNVCWSCPVSDACLNDALATKDAWGVRGGYTHLERARIAQLEKGVH